MSRVVRHLGVLALVSLAVGCASGSSTSFRQLPAAPSFDEVLDQYTEARAFGPLAERDCRVLPARFERIEPTNEVQYKVARFNAARIREHCGDRAGAYAGYAQLAENGFRPAVINLAEMLVGEGSLDQAEEVLQRQAERMPSSHVDEALARVRRARYVETGEVDDFKSAQRHLMRLLAKDGANIFAAEHIGRLYLARAERGHPGYALLARHFLEHALHLAHLTDQSDAELQEVVALVEAHEGKLAASVRANEKALESNPVTLDANLNLAIASIRVRDFEAAEQYTLLAVSDREGSNLVESWLVRGVALRGRGEFDRAEATYLVAASLDPSDPRPWFNLGILYQEHMTQREEVDMSELQRLHEEARGHYRKALKLAREQPDHAQLAHDARHRIDILEEVHRPWPDHPPPHPTRPDPAVEKAERARLLELERKALEAARAE